MELVVQNPPTNAGDVRNLGSIPGFGIFPGGGRGNPLQYPCRENPHGQRSLEGYSPWGRKESDMTEATWQSTAQREDFKSRANENNPTEKERKGDREADWPAGLSSTDFGKKAYY